MAKGGSHKPTSSPYTINSESEFNSTDYLLTGGDIVYAQATVQLLLGDVVFKTSVKDQVTKSITPANYATMIGVVVGGKQTDFKVIQDDALIGVLVAAAANEGVLVMMWGVAKVVSDAALATIGTKVTGASTTAGRVGTTGAASGNFVGVTLDAAASAGLVIRMGVNYAG
jgi:hypothetical protein